MGELKLSVERSESGARGEIPLLQSSGSVQGGTEGCEGAELTLGLMRAVRFGCCCSGAQGVGEVS